MKGRLSLIHWRQAEAREFARQLRADGWEVEMEMEDGARAYRRILESQPDAVVIYLTRLPSHGRETAQALRSHKAGGSLPIVFVDGAKDKLEKVRAKVPDATFIASSDLSRVLSQLLRAGNSS